MDYNDNRRGAIRAFFVLCIVVWCLFTLNTGFYVDENGLLTIYKGIYQGQRMFIDSWESLQTGGILAYPLIWLYYRWLEPVFSIIGFNIGLVLFMRIAYVIIRGVIALYLYSTIHKTTYTRGAFYAAVFYFSYVVAWKNFSYKSFCEMAIMLIICFWIRYLSSRKFIYFVWIGCACSVAILAYPTMIIMAVILGILFIMETYHNEMNISHILCFIITCLVCGGVFLAYLQLTSGLPEIFSELKYLGDQDYEEGIIVRLGRMLISYVGLAFIAYLPIALIIVVRKFRNVSKIIEKEVLTIYWFVFFLGICIMRLESVSNSRLIYGLIIIYFWFPYLVIDKEESEYTLIGSYKNETSSAKKELWIFFIISTAAQLIWAVSTNQEVTVPGYMSVYAVIAVILIASREDNEMLGLIRGLIVSVVFFLCFWVAESNGGYSDILKERWIVEQGELKGIALLPKEYEANKIVYDLVSKYVSEDEKLLVTFGSNSTGYLNSCAEQGTYSVYARTQKNTKLLDFYNLHPDRQADYVLIDKANSKWKSFQRCETGKYILNNYTNVIAAEGDFVLLGREVVE